MIHQEKATSVALTDTRILSVVDFSDGHGFSIGILMALQLHNPTHIVLSDTFILEPAIILSVA